MAARSLARSTIAGRRGGWSSWMDHAGAGWTEAGHVEVEAWLAGRALGASAANRALSDLASFYRWARREGLTTANPTDLVDRPRRPRRVPRPADPAGVERALALGHPVDRRAVAVMVYAGLRCCELAGLAVGDVDLVEGWLEVTGKGGHRRRVPILRPLEPWLAGLAGEPASTPVYPSPRGGFTSAGRVSARVGAHLRAAEAGATAHQLRHRYGTHLYGRHGDLQLVALLMGHANVSTTQGYAEASLGGHGAPRDLW
jgi:site-specific recombinase XerC